MPNQEIGFIGVGLMGRHMARHLLAGGYSVLAHDIDPAKVAAIIEEGAKIATPGEIAAAVDIIILSLPNSAVVNTVIRDNLHLFETTPKGLIVIDTSTGEPLASRELAAQLGRWGIEMLDATVSGTSEMCAVKDVIFMVGGKQHVFEQCKPIFAAMGKESIYMGASGAGGMTKLVVNLVLGLNRMALAEGLTLARKAGLDPSQALEVLKKSAAYSKAMDQKGRRMVEKRFHPAAGRMASSYKGARLMLALGERLDCPLPLLSLYTQAMASEVGKGRGAWDNADIIGFYDALANFND
jgi:2-hydroxy-3-oxopropionate reductase